MLGRMGQASPPPRWREIITEGTKPRPVTAETAYHYRLLATIGCWMSTLSGAGTISDHHPDCGAG